MFFNNIATRLYYKYITNEETALLFNVDHKSSTDVAEVRCGKT
jgi:hypothetical protein